MKRFVCADVHPGCDRVFTGPGDQAVLDRVLAHTAADHGLPRPTMAFIEQVVIATRPVAGEERRRLTLVGADPRDGSGDRGRRWLRPVGPSGHGTAGLTATVTALPDRAAREHRTYRYRHECWLYRGDSEFVAVVVPFIADGLARDQLVQAAAAAGLTGDRAAKLAAAAAELAVAAHRDSGNVRIRLWPDRTAVLCEITDRAVIDNPMTGRSATPAWTGTGADRRDRAIRLANQLCDLVQVRSGPDGTAVRLHIRRSTPPARNDWSPRW